jgi:hypothetical protein
MGMAARINTFAFASGLDDVFERYYDHYDLEHPTSANAWALLDLDQRSITAQTALESAVGLQKAKTVYQEGRGGGGSSGGGSGNSLTMQSLSTDGSLLNRNHSTFATFSDFYGGQTDYADQWIQGAFDGSSVVTLGGADREFDFGKLKIGGRSSAARWGTVVLNVWMGVVGLLERSFASCSASNVDDAHTAWDEAFALYTGSLAESEEPLGGYFLYNLAQICCLDFGTCAKGQEAPVNRDIIDNFVLGKGHIRDEQCARLQNNVQIIEELLKVPLTQASLRAMYAMDLEDDVRPEIQGAAAAFGAAVAPITSQCSTGSGDIIYNDMARPGNGPTGSFEVVKSALERNYDCMGVTCKQIGGIITLRGDAYLERAEACGGVTPVEGAGIGDSGGGSGGGGGRGQAVSNGEGSSANISLVVGLTFLTVALGLGLGSWWARKLSRKEFDTAVDTKTITTDAEYEDPGVVVGESLLLPVFIR